MLVHYPFSAFYQEYFGCKRATLLAKDTLMYLLFLDVTAMLFPALFLVAAYDVISAKDELIHKQVLDIALRNSLCPIANIILVHKGIFPKALISFSF